mmetsp:Transcript_73944/g.216984  ORF Transcript_73944/g.216984 Transcript_73944/m.216984 type:complete len:272 (+) Transcript_73944:560-1375(+)
MGASNAQHRRHGVPTSLLKVKALNCGVRIRADAEASADVDAPTDADCAVVSPRPCHRLHLLPTAASVDDAKHLTGGMWAHTIYAYARRTRHAAANRNIRHPRKDYSSRVTPWRQHLSRQNFSAALPVGKLGIEALYRAVHDNCVHVLATADVESAADDCCSCVRALHAQPGKGRAPLPLLQPEVELLHHPRQLTDSPADIDMTTNDASHTSQSPNLHGRHGLPLARAQVEALHRIHWSPMRKINAATKGVEPPRLHGRGALTCGRARLLQC